MNPTLAFVTSLVLVALLALFVIRVLRRPLADLLAELCGNDRRARFWTVFVGIGIVLASLECALIVMPGNASTVWTGLQEVRVLLSVLRAGLFGLLVGFGALGVVLLVSIGRFEQNRRIEAAS